MPMFLPLHPVGIELEQTTQPVATVNGPARWHKVRSREEEEVFALVPSERMMIDVLSQCTA
jgi:hypothetical protein